MSQQPEPASTAHKRAVSSADNFDFDVTHYNQAPELQVRWAGRETLQDYQPIRVDRYTFTIFGLVREGKMVLSNGERSTLLIPGSAFWIRAGHYAMRTPQPGPVVVQDMVMVFGDQTVDLFSTMELPPVGAVVLKKPALAETLMDEILNEGRLGLPKMASHCLALTEVLMGRIASQYHSGKEERHAARQSYLRCREYILTHYTSIRSLREVAQQCGVSTAYMCRLFMRHCQMRPHQVLTQARINRATRLLTGTDAKIGDIAKVVGYSSVSQFTRLFTNAHGVSPRVYRANHI